MMTTLLTLVALALYSAHSSSAAVIHCKCVSTPPQDTAQNFADSI